MKQPTPLHFTVLESAMMGPIYHLLVGICANGYPFSHIHTNKWYSPHHRTLQYWKKVQPCTHVSFITRYMCKCSLKKKKKYYLFIAESNKIRHKKILNFFILIFVWFGEKTNNIFLLHIYLPVNDKWVPLSHFPVLYVRMDIH